MNANLAHSLLEVGGLSDWLRLVSQYSDELNDSTGEALLDARIRELEQRETLNEEELLVVRLKIAKLLNRLTNGYVSFSEEELEQFDMILYASSDPDEVELKIPLRKRLLEIIDRNNYPLRWGHNATQLGIEIMQKEGSLLAEKQQALNLLLSARACVEELKNEDDTKASIDSAIGAALLSRVFSDNPEVVEQAIEHLEKALAFFRHTVFEEEQATVLLNLGQAYLRRTLGNDTRNIEQAIDYLEQSLRIAWLSGNYKQRTGCTYYLGNAYSKRGDGDQSENRRKAISYYEQLLDSSRVVLGEEMWATTKQNLSTVLVSIDDEHKATRQLQAVKHLRDVEPVFKQGYPIKDWINCIHGIAKIYLEMDAKNHIENIENAINILEPALSLLEKQGPSEQLAELHNMLGIAYSERHAEYAEDLRKNLAKAQEHYLQAIETFREVGRLDRVMGVMRNATISGNAQGDLPSKEYIRGAIEELRKLLKLLEREGSDEDVADCLVSLGNALAQDIENRPKSLYEARRCYEQALNFYKKEKHPSQWAGIQFNLGNALSENEHWGLAQNLEDSLECYRNALQVINKQNNPKRWVVVNRAISKILRDRIQGDIIKNYELALKHAIDAATIFSRDEDEIEWALCKVALANIKMHLPYGPLALNCSEAIDHLNGALEVFTKERFPARHAETQFNLGTAYSKRNLNKADENFAIKAFQAALAGVDKNQYPKVWAYTHINLSNVLLKDSGAQQAGRMREAIIHLEAASSIFSESQYPFQAAMIKLNLGHRNYQLSVAKKDSAYLDQAIKYYIAALTFFEEENTVEYVHACYAQLTKSYFLKDDIAKAIEYGQTLIDAVDARLDASVSDSGKIDLLADMNEAIEIVAFCMAKKGELKRAVEVVDSARARILSDTLAEISIDRNKLEATEQIKISEMLRDIQIHESRIRQAYMSAYVNDSIEYSTIIEHKRRNLRLYIDNIAARNPDIYIESFDIDRILRTMPPNKAIAVPIVTMKGTMLLLLTPDSNNPITSIPVDDFDQEKLRQLVFGDDKTVGFLAAYVRSAQGASEWSKYQLREKLDEVLQSLWDQLVSKFFAEIQNLKISHLAIVPQGIMQLIPFEGAWRSFKGTRRYLIDDIEIDYAPSLKILAATQEKIIASKDLAKRVCILADPTKDLPFASLEAKIIGDIFGDEATYIEPDEPLLSRLSHYPYIHFACHGVFNIIDPWNSALHVGKNEYLTLNDIVSKLDLEGTRLVVLSACETGMFDYRNAPNEYIGLSAGFILTGCAGVVNSLWRVDDRATSLLMSQFYKYHIEEGNAPGTALRKAKQWLRNATVADTEGALSGADRLDDSQFQVEMREILGEVRPYSKPWFWAPFILTGG